MGSLSLEPTAQAQWHCLVEEAVAASGARLEEELKGYLTLLLMRFANQPTLFGPAVAMDYLQTLQEWGPQRRDHLRDIGDKCLLYSGLFPGRAQRQRVSAHYYVDLGQSAYGLLANLANTEINRLYLALCHNFIALMDVLLAARTLEGDLLPLTPLQAHALWSATGSQQAYKILQSISGAMPLKIPPHPHATH